MVIAQQQHSVTGWADHIWEEGWIYIKAVVDTVYEPFLILDKNLCVLAANRSFYRLFHASAKDAEHKYINELGNGAWNIPAMESLLKVILPRNIFFNGFEVNRQFPSLGKKMMVLKSGTVYRENKPWDIFPPLILLAMRDITELDVIIEALGYCAAEIENNVIKRTKHLEAQIGQLKEEIGGLTMRSPRKLL